MVPVVPVAALLTAGVIAWAVCGALRPFALSRGIVSTPQDVRAGPGGVPLLGGLGTLAGLAGGLIAAWAVARIAGGAHLGALSLWPAVGWAGLIAGFALVGWRDDVTGLAPGVRLLLECLWGAAILALPLLLGPEAGAGFGPAVATGAHPAIVPDANGWAWTLAALVLVVSGANAFNMTDNADGLAAGTGALALGGLALLLRPATGCGWAALAGLAGAGALAGFLVWNRPPARLYLGDAGALALGAVGAALVAVHVRAAGATADLLALPFVIGYALVDPAYAVLGRLRRGAPPWRGGVDHLSHDLGASLRGWPRAWRLVMAVQAFSVLSGLGVLEGVLPTWTLAATACPWAGLWLAGSRGRRLRTARRK